MSTNELLEVSEDFDKHPTTKWVKGELHDDLLADSLDPKGFLTAEYVHSPFDRLSWFERVQRHFPDAGRPLIARAKFEGHQCWLFLAQGEGNSTTALTNWYSMAFRPIFVGGQAPELLHAIAKRLLMTRTVAPIITLAPVPRSDGSSDMLVSSFRKSGWIALRHQSSTSWTANVAGKSFEQYWSERPGQLRNTFQRKAKKAAIQTEILTDFNDAAWEAYESVYGESWKTAEGAPAFLREMAMDEAKAGQLRLGLARLDGEVIAAQFWTVDQKTAYIHKLAHREEFKEFSPGTILSVALFRHVIDLDKVSSIDFGTGNDAYKADWMDRSDPLDTIRLFKKTSLIGVLSATRARISALVHRAPLD